MSEMNKENETVKITRNEGVDLQRVVILRPVIVKNRKGYFHTWGQWADCDGANLAGVVEFEDGTCDYYPPEMIKFLDRVI